MPTEWYEEVQRAAERARAEVLVCLETVQRRRAEIASRLAELRSGDPRDPTRELDSERHAREARASLELARGRDVRAHERAARAHDAAARYLEVEAAASDAREDRAGAERQRAAALRERQAAEQNRRAARNVSGA